MRALHRENTKEFNELYGKTNVGKKPLKRIPSQFEAAREALRAESPVVFEEQLNLSPRPTFGGKRKTRRNLRKHRKLRKSKRRQRR